MAQLPRTEEPQTMAVRQAVGETREVGQRRTGLVEHLLRSTQVTQVTRAHGVRAQVLPGTPLQLLAERALGAGVPRRVQEQRVGEHHGIPESLLDSCINTSVEITLPIHSEKRVSRSE